MNHKIFNRKGATAVEFAVTCTILFVFIFAGVEFARIGMIRHSADNAAYEAARHVMVPGGTVAEAEELAERFLRNAFIKNANVTVSPDPILEDSPLVTVTVDIPIDDNAWGISMFTRGRRVVASSTLHTERPPSIQAEALPTRPTPPPPTIPPPTNPPTTTVPTPTTPIATPTPPTRPPTPPRPPRRPQPPRPRR